MKSLSASNIIFNVINYTFLAIFGLLCLYPFYYIFIYSISLPGEAASGGFYLLPSGFSLINYKQILVRSDIYSAGLISVLRTLAGTVLAVFCSSLYAYLVTKKQLIFRKFFYRASVITMYVSAGLIPVYMTFKMLHINNTFLIYILPGAVSAFFIILIKTYIEQMPPAIEESAMIDGASYWKIFIKIILPLCGPIIATVAIFTSVGQWNSWQDNFFFVSNKHLKVLQLVLWDYLSSAISIAENVKNGRQMSNYDMMNQITPVSVRMTITMITTIPILLVYPFMQRYFIKGIMIGAVKG